MNESKKEYYCEKIYKWTKKRSAEPSTWRGLALSGAAIVAAINPAAGVVAAKLAAAVVGAVEIFKSETRRKED